MSKSLLCSSLPCTALHCLPLSMSCPRPFSNQLAVPCRAAGGARAPLRILFPCPRGKCCALLLGPPPPLPGFASPRSADGAGHGQVQCGPISSCFHHYRAHPTPHQAAITMISTHHSARGTVFIKHSAVRRQTTSEHYHKELNLANLRTAVEAPDGITENSFLATNLVDFFNELGVLYGACQEDAARFTKPGEGFPLGFQFLWSPSGLKDDAKPVSSPQYVAAAFGYVSHICQDESIMPADDESFPPDFKVKHVKRCFQLFYRIFAIIILVHGPFLQAKFPELFAQAQRVFKHFCFFDLHWSVLDPSEEDFKALEKEYMKNKKDYGHSRFV